MKILILGAGKMGSFLCDLLSQEHDVAIIDRDRQRLLFTFGCRRFESLDEVDDFKPDMVINAVTVKYTLDVFRQVLPHLPKHCILSDIASVKTGLPEFYAGAGHPFVSTHPMFGPTFASLSHLSNENAIIIKEGDHLGRARQPPAFGVLLVRDVAGLRRFQLSGNQPDLALAAGAVARAGRVDGDVRAAGRLQKIVPLRGVQHDLGAVHLKGYRNHSRSSIQ